MDNQASPLVMPQPVDQPKPKKLYLFTVVFLASLLIITTSLSIIFFLQANSPPKNTPATNLEKVPKIKSDQSSITLPIKPDDPEVVAARILYTFDAIIREVKTGPETEIITNLKAPVPKLLITPKTEIYLVNKSSSQKTDASALQPQQKIRLIIYYGLKTRKWTTSRINILTTDSGLTSTPSASLKPESPKTLPAQ